MEGNRYFLIENEGGSDIFDLSSFRKLWNTGGVGKITFPQCTVDLRIKEELAQRWTELWSNDGMMKSTTTGAAAASGLFLSWAGAYQN